MLKALLELFKDLFKHEHNYQIVGATEATAEGGYVTNYAVAICMHPLCNSKRCFHSTNREIHIQWLKDGKEVTVRNA